MIARQPFRIAVLGDRIDLTDVELLRSAQVAYIPHDRMGIAQRAQHECWARCGGLWRVLVIESGKVTHVWNAPSQRTAEACCKRLRRHLADGTYPIDPTAPSRITLGTLEARTDAKGRLKLPKQPSTAR